MKDDINEYIIGFCKYCNQCKAIKNGLCIDCEKKSLKVEDIFPGIFDMFKGEK